MCWFFAFMRDCRGWAEDGSGGVGGWLWVLVRVGACGGAGDAPAVAPDGDAFLLGDVGRVVGHEVSVAGTLDVAEHLLG